MGQRRVGRGVGSSGMGSIGSGGSRVQHADACFDDPIVIVLNTVLDAFSSPFSALHTAYRLY